MDEYVLQVQLRDCDPGTTLTGLRPGESTSLGPCPCVGCSFDVVLPADRAGASVALRVTAASDHWRLTNLGSTRLVVENRDQPIEYFTLDTHRAEVPVPFEAANVGSGARGGVELVVLGPRSVVADAGREACRRSTSSGYGIDRTTIYFAVMVALCEARLRSGPGAALPASSQIATTIQRWRGVELSPRAVDGHIDYLIDKMGIRPATAETAGRRGWKREALVAAALRGGLVSIADVTTPSRR
jgi:hypothetical protein